MTSKSLWLSLVAVLSCAGVAFAQSHTHFPLDQVPAFNIPRMSRPPTIDGRIEPQEWAQAVRLMGVAPAHSNSFFGRPVTFFVAWDPEHLYIAARSDLRQGEILVKQKRERTTMGVVFDDAYEFGLFLFDRNKSVGESSFFFKFILNALLAGEYMRMYPSIGQYLYNWYPSFNVRSRVTEDGRWWEMEIAMGLADLAMPVPHRGEVRFDVEKPIPGLEYGAVNGRRMDGIFEVKVALADAPDTPPIFKTFSSASRTPTRRRPLG